MARRVRDSVLDSRAARDRLKAQKEPHWRSVSQGLHIGYRKGTRDRTWIARKYDSATGRYKFKKLGVADDHADADGQNVLSFGQAQDFARAWLTELTSPIQGYNVSDAIDDYLIEYRKHGKSERDIKYRVDAFIQPKMGTIEVASLTSRQIRTWHSELASAPARLRTRKGKDQQSRSHDDSDTDAVRRRRHTANKVLTILKAALNHAFAEGRAATDQEWRRVKPFKGVDRPRVRFPVDAMEPVRLVNACEEEFRALVRGALLSGARYGELGRLAARDYDPDQGTIYIAPGKTGYARHVVLTKEGQEFFDGVTAGRSPEELIFARADGTGWGKSHQARPMADACKNAKIEPPISFHILRHWYAASLVKAGVPISIVAENLGHQDPKITMRHYGHLAPSEKAEVIRSLAPSMGIGAGSILRRIGTNES